MVFPKHEEACKSQLLAEAVGEPISIPHETACSTRDYVANDLSAFASLQPMLDVLWEEEPDFFLIKLSLLELLDIHQYQSDHALVHCLTF